MANPVLITLTRGPLAESVHRGSMCITGPEGELAIVIGDIDAPVYPRSAIKLLQALPLVESGAADAAGFTDAELALACSSHNGEKKHAETARAMLAKLSLGADDMACGAHWPMYDEAARALAAAGEKPSPLHNNCSGKHAGMLALARQLGVPVKGYQAPDHPVQERIRQMLEEMTGNAASPDVCATDGCSVPTWAMPLKGLACAFARLATLTGMPDQRTLAASRLMHACASEPFMVEGTGRFGTGVMRRLGGKAFVKGGAEGMYCAAFPEQGLGMALKMDDGARRGSEAVAAHVIAALFHRELEDISEIYSSRLTNWRGTHVGDIRVSEELKQALDKLR